MRRRPAAGAPRRRRVSALPPLVCPPSPARRGPAAHAPLVGPAGRRRQLGLTARRRLALLPVPSLSSGSRRRHAAVVLRHSGRAAAFAPRFGRLPSRPPVRNSQGGNSLRLSDHSPLGSASGERVVLRAAYSLSAALARIRRAGRHTVADPHRQSAAFPPGVPGESEAPPPGPPPPLGAIILCARCGGLGPQNAPGPRSRP